MKGKQVSTLESEPKASKTDSRAKRRHKFSLETEPGSTVFVAGSFNSWNPKKLMLRDKHGNGFYECTVLLSPGPHQYKFHVDGAWCIDPANPRFSPNDMGTLNSVLDVD